MTRTVHLGFAVGSGDPVEIPIRHLVVTGQTQESGKTTTLEALIRRSGLRAIVCKAEGCGEGRQVMTRQGWTLCEVEAGDPVKNRDQDGLPRGYQVTMFPPRGAHVS